VVNVPMIGNRLEAEEGSAAILLDARLMIGAEEVPVIVAKLPEMLVVTGTRTDASVEELIVETGEELEVEELGCNSLKTLASDEETELELALFPIVEEARVIVVGVAPTAGAISGSPHPPDRGIALAGKTPCTTGGLTICCVHEHIYGVGPLV